MSDWRSNPNLVECYENCVAMLASMPAARTPSRGDIVKRRRLALGLTATALGVAAGYRPRKAVCYVSRAEHGSHWYQPIADTLDRLEAERAQ